MNICLNALLRVHKEAIGNYNYSLQEWVWFSGFEIVAIAVVIDAIVKDDAFVQEFDVASTKMGMTEEMMNDTLDDILNERWDNNH